MKSEPIPPFVAQKPELPQSLVVIRSMGRISSMLTMAFAFLSGIGTVGSLRSGTGLMGLCILLLILILAILLGLASRRMEFKFCLLACVICTSCFVSDWGIGCLVLLLGLPTLSASLMLCAGLINHPPAWLVTILKPGWRPAIPKHVLCFSPLDEEYRSPLICSFLVGSALVYAQAHPFAHGIRHIIATTLSNEGIHNFNSLLLSTGLSLATGVFCVSGVVICFVLLMGEDALERIPQMEEPPPKFDSLSPITVLAIALWLKKNRFSLAAGLFWGLSVGVPCAAYINSFSQASEQTLTVGVGLLSTFLAGGIAFGRFRNMEPGRSQS